MVTQDPSADLEEDAREEFRVEKKEQALGILDQL